MPFKIRQPVVPAWHVQPIANIIRSGGVVAYPTEAVFGLGCDPLNQIAVLRLLKIKKRPVRKGLILIASDFDQLKPFVQTLPKKQMKRVLDSWPGPHTWIFPASPLAPKWVTGQFSSIAVRVTAHPLASALCQACDMPIVSTSANHAGQPPAKSDWESRLRLGRDLDGILAGSVGKAKKPTAIRDARNGILIR